LLVLLGWKAERPGARAAWRVTGRLGRRRGGASGCRACRRLGRAGPLIGLDVAPAVEVEDHPVDQCCLQATVTGRPPRTGHGLAGQRCRWPAGEPCPLTAAPALADRGDAAQQ